MKLGIFFIAIGIVCFIALVAMLVLNLIMKDYFGVFWGTVYTSIAGGLSLHFGITRIKKARREQCQNT